jgi:hypothetical protein
MSQRIADLPTILGIAILTLISACATQQPPVVEKLDELTAVTITYSRTPYILSQDTTFDRANERSFLQVGSIEVNQMGSLDYYLWLGISDMSEISSAQDRPEAYESIVLVADNAEMRFDVLGWAATAIGASEPVYNKLFATSLDAYYPITLDQLQLLADAADLKLRTKNPAAREFIPWYKQATSRADLAEFLRVTSRPVLE